MKKEYLSTYWMDFITYIVLPFVTIVSAIRIVRSLLYNASNLTFVLALLVELCFMVLYIMTAVCSHKRAKNGYKCFLILVSATALRASVDFALSGVTGYNSILSFIGYLLICILLWVYPNFVYFRKRKDIFKNDISTKKNGSSISEPTEA